MRIAAVTFILLSLSGCLGSNDDFSSVLGDTDGGSGTASIAITSYSPGVSSLVMKSTATQQFLVSATGKGTLTYKWTLDGATVGTNSPALSLDANNYSVGSKVLLLTINDEIGSISQSWNVKINGTPVITASSPVATSAFLRRSVLKNYSVTVTDPNSDVLTYVWKLDGVESVLVSATNAVNWTPSTTDVGTHTVSVDIYDGPASDTGTYKVTRSWTTYVNHFTTSCNDMENNAETNKVCMLVGIPGIGDGQNPETSPSDFYIRPSALAFDSAGNQFIADDANHVVWFWNKYTSPSVTVLGVTVPLNQMKVVAGVGMGQSGSSASTKALRNFLNTPHGIAWDGTYLYISDTSNNRGWRVDSNGDMSFVFTTGCTSPRGMTVTGGTLYVACYSSNIVRSYNTSTFAAATFAGTGGATNPTSLAESTFTDATNGRLNGPYGVASDSAGNIYVGEHTGCRVHLYNMTASTITLFGSYTISSGRQRIIAGAPNGPTCTTATGEPVDITAAANGGIGNVRLMSFTSNGQLLIAHDNDQISALNFSATASPLLDASVPGYTLRTMWGTGTAGYLGEGQLGSATRFNNPFQAAEDPINGDIYIPDYSNLRYRKIRSSDYKTELIAGNGSTRAQTNAGQGLVEATQEKMNSVRGIAVDSVTGEIFIADSGNNRIRVINRQGQSSQAVGTGGAGTGAEEDEFPTSSTMSSPRNMVLTHSTSTYGGHLIWADAGNHRIRVWNRSSSAATIFGVLVSAGRVATIGGNGVAGNLTSGSALQAAFNTPSGVTYDGTNLYVADTNNHCIKKIDSSGTLSAFAGTCGTSGNANGPVGVGTMNAPEGIDYYVNGTHRGLIIAARGNGRVKFHRMAGSSLLFGGSTSIGDTNSIACMGTFHTEGIQASLTPCSGVYDVAAVGSKVCFTNQTFHNVRCIESNGVINTVLGPVQGQDDTTPMYFPGISFAHEDYNSTATFPNYTSQGGVAAFTLPATIAPPALMSSFGQVTYPIPIRAIDASTLLVGEYNLGFIRKVKLP